MTDPSLHFLADLFATDYVATMLSSSDEQLRFLLYGRSPASRYSSFKIAKRRGGWRSILAPKEDLKSIQRRLACLLQERIVVKAAAHGFVQERSIVTNAAQHRRHRTVLNVDLKDFFPSINFGRVRGVLIAEPLSFSPKVATVLAQICCHEGTLPQGAPTSPVISNMICYRLDAQLMRLAREHKCVYTRYADDLTFSKRKGTLPPELGVENEDGMVTVGTPLRSIIETNGFQIHPDKVRLYRNTTRQSVTGLVVNDRVNVPRSFIRGVRAMIHDWKRNGLERAEAEHHSKHYRHPHRRVGKKPSLAKIIEGKLSFLRMVKGVADPVRRNLQCRFAEVWPDYQAILEKENGDLAMRDLFISHASEDKDTFVRPFVKALICEGVSVWYDEYEMTIGDDLAAKIDDGLSKSLYGVVVLSAKFFDVKKTWPKREVSGLFALEDSDHHARVLPLWHGVGKADVASKSPILAGKVAWKTGDCTIVELAAKFRDFLKTRRK